MRYSPDNSPTVTTWVVNVEISKQLFDQATIDLGRVNHRRVRSQRTRRRLYKAMPLGAAMFFNHVRVPNTWPADWRQRAIRTMQW